MITEIGAFTSRGRYHRHHHALFITVVRHTGVGQFTGVRLSIGVRDLIGVQDGAYEPVGEALVGVGEVDVIGEARVGEFVLDGAAAMGRSAWLGRSRLGNAPPLVNRFE